MRKNHFVKVAAVVCIIVCIVSIAGTYFVTKSIYEPRLDSAALPITDFTEVEQIINDYYLRDYNMEDLQYAALKAMVAELNDPYSVYYTPEEYAALTQDLSGEYYGLGMMIAIDQETGYAKVQYFLDGSPAEAAGMLAGDLIVTVDGQDIKGLTLQEISVLCLGENGTEITLGIMRGGEPLSFTLQRGPISRDMVTYDMLPGDIGYMDIVQFGGNCEALFVEAINYFQENGVKGVLIDLRNNPGGYLDVVVSMLDMLLPEGTLVYTEDRRGNRETYFSDEACIDIPLVLLVNSSTASAAEIFAGAIQDYDWGAVVGTKTYGKGVVQNVIPLKSTGGGIKITSSEYFTPKGRSIDGNGIYPDVYVGSQTAVVTDPSQTAFYDDPQIARGLAVLAEEMAEAAG